MIVACPACSTKYDIDPSRLRGGRGRLRCARCKTLFPVEMEASAAPAPPPQRPTPARLDVALVGAEAGGAREALVAMLASAGVRTLTADDGPAALEAVRRSRPRLALLAFHLRGLQGPEVAQLVRDEPALAATRLVLVGGPPSRGRHQAPPALIHEVDGWLPEDASPEETLALVRMLLDPADGAGRLERDELERLARVAAADLAAYHADVVERCVRERRMLPELGVLVDAMGPGLAARLAGARLAPGALDALRAGIARRLGI